MFVWDELNRPWIEHWGIPQKKDPELLVLNHLILRLMLIKYPVGYPATSIGNLQQK